MSWERDPLWAKARLFFEHALAHDRDDPRFGLWCAFGLEMLARATVASVSPTLLAEPHRDHIYLLHAVGRGSPKVDRRSLSAAQLFNLCEVLFSEFKSEQKTSALALVNRRNAELHTGENAFGTYTTRQWIAGFYACCQALVAPLGETLTTLLGEAEAKEAEHVLAVAEREVRTRVRGQIAAHRRVFQERDEVEREAARTLAEETGNRLAHQRHHRVPCPACESVATVQGDPLGSPNVVHDDEDGTIVVKQAIAPRRFACPACGLKLDGYAELSAAGLGDQYTRTVGYSPEEYYELISPDDHDEIERIARDRLGLHKPYEDEYDNE